MQLMRRVMVDRLATIATDIHFGFQKLRFMMFLDFPVVDLDAGRVKVDGHRGNPAITRKPAEVAGVPRGPRHSQAEYQLQKLGDESALPVSLAG